MRIEADFECGNAIVQQVTNGYGSTVTHPSGYEREILSVVLFSGDRRSGDIADVQLNKRTGIQLSARVEWLPSTGIL